MFQFHSKTGHVVLVNVAGQNGAWLALLRPAVNEASRNTLVYLEGEMMFSVVLVVAVVLVVMMMLLNVAGQNRAWVVLLRSFSREVVMSNPVCLEGEMRMRIIMMMRRRMRMIMVIQMI